MRTATRCALILTVLLLAGCGDPLVTTYGAVDVGSVNGLTVLQGAIRERTRLRRFHLLSPRLDKDCQLLIHVARQPGVPDEEACAWLQEWLEDQDGRQAVLVLRDGNLAPWLCRRWALQAQGEALRSGDQGLSILARRLDRRAQDEEEPLLAAPAEIPSKPDAAADDDRERKACMVRPGPLHSPLIDLKPGPRLHPSSLNGLDLRQVPLAMTAGTRVTMKTKDVRPLVEVRFADGTAPVAWAQYGHCKSSRLVVVANAMPLLDGALPDPAARQLSAQLVEHILAFHRSRPACAWVNTLAVRSDEPEPSNPMALLFGVPPVSWCTWHALAALILALASVAWWLGRREAPRDRRPDRFIRHVLALAEQLRTQDQAAWCARAIARCRGLPPPPHLPDAAAARAWLAGNADAASGAHHPVPPPPTSTTRPTP